MMQDILHDSPIYQMIVQEGVEIGVQQGIEKALQDQQVTILRIIQAKFPKLVRLATKQVTAITDLKKLQELNVSMSVIHTEEEARQRLTAINNKK